MGSIVEIIDMLRITKEQGFPAELNVKKHLQNFVDYCRANDLEIYHETLFVAQALHAPITNDKQNLLASLSDFLTHNASVLQRL